MRSISNKKNVIKKKKTSLFYKCKRKALNKKKRARVENYLGGR